MPLLQLSYSGHYPDILVEATEEDIERINVLTERTYLTDTDEGRSFLEELKSRPRVKMYTVIAYI